MKTRISSVLILLLVGCRSHAPETDPVSPTQGEQASAAAQVVRLQYDAYNRHDTEAFVAAHVADVRLYHYPDSLRINGRDSLRARIARLFADAPQLHATVDVRMTHGDIVVWKETVTGLSDGKTNAGISIWEVHAGVITRVTFIP
jgi:hypothetical protein